MSAKDDKLEIYRDRAGEWRWRRVARDGQIVGAVTEGYTHKSDCVANMERQFIRPDGDPVEV